MLDRSSKMLVKLTEIAIKGKRNLIYSISLKIEFEMVSNAPTETECGGGEFEILMRV